jgi:hypothetical protein
VPPETIGENVQLLQGFVGNLTDSQIRFDGGTKNEIVKTSQTDFVHRAVDRGVLSRKRCDFSSSEAPRVHFNDMCNQRVQAQRERRPPVKELLEESHLGVFITCYEILAESYRGELVVRGSLRVQSPGI